MKRSFHDYVLARCQRSFPFSTPISSFSTYLQVSLVFFVQETFISAKIIKKQLSDAHLISREINLFRLYRIFVTQGQSEKKKETPSSHKHSNTRATFFSVTANKYHIYTECFHGNFVPPNFVACRWSPKKTYNRNPLRKRKSYRPT